MAKDQFPKLEVPAEVREVVDRTVAQARTAFDGFLTATHKAVSTFEDQANTAQSQSREMAKKAVTQAEMAIADAFDHAQKLVKAKDLNEIVALQTAYLRAQAEKVQAQAQEIGQTVSKAASDAMNKVR